MTDRGSQTRGLPVGEVRIEPRRRKVRKGTQSCWECKRKKIKCIFTAPTDSLCHGCKRRGTPCISQEFPEDPGSTRRQLGDRLGRVEELVGRLIRDSRKDDPNDTSPRSTQSDGRVEHRYLTGQADGASTSPSSTTLNWNGQDPAVRLPITAPSNSPSLLVNAISLGRDTSTADTYNDLSRTLSAAWPSLRDLNIILSIGFGGLAIFHGVICMPYSKFMGPERPSPQKMLQLPPPGSHPVLIAQKLLMLGTYLQGIPPTDIEALKNLSIPHRDTMHRAVETASRLVTSNDDLVNTIEGIECIMIESMYRNNEGNLRRAYLIIRRALVIAQMIGLDRGNNSSLLKALEPETRTRIDPAYMWFRIIQSDRYLSLMLGLPQGTLDNDFAIAEVMEECSPMERMERMVCSAGGQIIQRKHDDKQNFAFTQETDKLLRGAAALMPPQWWLAPDLSTRDADDLNVIHDTVRLMNQFTYYHLLQRLHLPYLLHPSTDPRYDYSKVTAVMASRELLSRFVPFRSSKNHGSFCRGVDFLAFIASTTLCLAHIDACRQINFCANEGRGSAQLGLLSHQRLSDRGMMERVLESMEYIGQTNNDNMATKIAHITRQLLSIEDDAAMGGSYKADSSLNSIEQEDLECNGILIDGGTGLKIYIPYIGTIRIERHGVFRPSVPAGLRSREIAGLTESFDPPLPGLIERPAEHVQSRRISEDCMSDNSTNIRPVGLQVQDDRAFDFNDTAGLYSQWFVPGLDSSDEWDLQGIDTAFFNSIFQFRGSE
ncbi:hypothetical protein BGW36DRAFT_288291 [Talaromyces proteolyticus]|uniref:Zn(2)-C6 fungal-type domain-containing protein n=1 Tax=Talaromyces proteolyticus TaxID=1131652 RepID=A0AAD4PZZ7_9EURO|nr:uncharacterized protein BGW36DRAFT_288291 [Talaromyces proteolyticus]KAH8703548.1 hypothetical protein BGW36DRAFT_288291 [Talaromyces proteolyticus]